MPKRSKPRTHVTIGGHTVPVLRAALIAVEAHRRGVLPRKVRRVGVPKPAPTHVVVAWQRLSVEAAAIFAEQADAQGILIEALITKVLLEEAERIGQRARRRGTRRPLEGAWRHGPESSRGDPDDG